MHKLLSRQQKLSHAPSINARMNLFYVLDSICHQSHKAGFSGYIDLIQRNLPKIIECVTPSGPKGNVNVAGTKKVLEQWRSKKLFQDSVIDKVEIPLLSRDLGASAPAITDAGFSKDDILKRMDEDRERHKRIREEIWIRPSDEDSDAEFSQNWEETSDLEDNDYEDIETENEKYLPNYPWTLEFDRFLPSPAIFKSKPTLSVNTEEPTDSNVAMKRLTSPEGTITVTSTGGRATSAASPAEYHHNGYHHPPGRDYSHPYSYPHARPQHHHHQQPPPPPQHSYSSTNSTNNSHSRNHSHSYYDPSIPTAPAAETSSSHRASPSSRRASPTSSYHPYARPQYHERTSSSSSTHAGTSL
ncbi:hypothetical protein BGZ80_011563 [Entomortierella chlamydospora]|uniref:CID domain-containing protein n=1 Tax=Entomortierella chlamydospora TaxID=101097 RepID=A0A9P6MT54_9FUNG|nr:hypothetical protein BGZ80_011563 [Entomortierella chlamydospora]